MLMPSEADIGATSTTTFPIAESPQGCDNLANLYLAIDWHGASGTARRTYT